MLTPKTFHPLHYCPVDEDRGLLPLLFPEVNDHFLCFVDIECEVIFLTPHSEGPHLPVGRLVVVGNQAYDAINPRLLVGEGFNTHYGYNITGALANKLAHRISVYINVEQTLAQTFPVLVPVYRLGATKWSRGQICRKEGE